MQVAFPLRGREVAYKRFLPLHLGWARGVEGTFGPKL
jgi:hypothetical protein